MKTKRFSALHLILVLILTCAVTLGACLLGVRSWLGVEGRTLMQAVELVRDKFVGEYDSEVMLDTALTGLVAGLDDRWSRYLTAQQYEAQEQARSNAYTGIGVTVSYEREEGLLIEEVTPDSPAQAAGLAAGEIITAADGTSLAGEGRYEGASLIQGEAGTAVELEVLGTDGQTRTVTVTRADIKQNPVESAMLEDSVGYVALANFYTGSAQAVEEAVNELVEQGARALIFDMRDNGGGYLSELTDMLDFLLPEGPIFRSRDVDGNETVTYSDASCVDLPMVVLVNADTYSAAEFFAAELQEQGVAKIVGEPTSGKGYSQQTYQLESGGAVSISTGAYFTGQGTSLIGTGLTLDEEVYLTDEGDAQLEAALALLAG